MILAPLMHGDRGIGCIAVTRPTLDGFVEKEEALLKTFADQAVIAIQNARLFNETKEALEKETATGEILRAISDSPTSTAPVFRAIAERSMALCDACYGFVFTYDGEWIRMGCHSGFSADGIAAVATHFPMRAGGHSLTARTIATKSVVNEADVLEMQGNRLAAAAGLADFRAGLGVPMLRQGQAVGAIVVGRPETGAFDARQVALLQTFADQAVIAIENVRLFNETQEALEQQTATSAVLQVISQSVEDPQPVFDAILASCAKLFRSTRMVLLRAGDDGLLHLWASRGLDEPARAQGIYPLSIRGTASEIAINERRLVTFADVRHDPDVPDALRHLAEELDDDFAVAVVPMIWEGRGIGVINVLRTAGEMFDEGERKLLTTFANQAVIAIQNSRLFNETKEALEQQTASAQVLQVISGSIADPQPVFDRILASTEDLFDADAMGVYLVSDDGWLHQAARRGALTGRITGQFPVRVEGTATAEAIARGRVVSYADVLEGDDVPDGLRRLARDLGTNYALAQAPMMWQGRGIGAINAARFDMRPFTEKECALLETFANQAVIAIQNARLFNETKEALEQQTATSEVLEAISNSVADTKPVFEKILDSCQQLIDCTDLAVMTVDEASLVHLGAARGSAGDRFAKYRPVHVDRTVIAEAVHERRLKFYADAMHGAHIPEVMRKMAAKLGNFSVVLAPMVWQGRGVGALVIARPPSKPFSTEGIGSPRNLCRSSGHRDSERCALQGCRARARRGGIGQRSEERVPRDHEPRDPHADERGDRHERPAARHEARRRPARVRGDDPRQWRRAAHDHQRHPRLLEDRGRQDGRRGASVRPARMRRVRARPRRRTRGREAPRRRVRVRRRHAGRDRRRCHAPASGAAQPDVERREVHRERRGRDHRTTRDRDRDNDNER